MNRMRYFDIDIELKDQQRHHTMLKHSQFMTMDFTRGEHFILLRQETIIYTGFFKLIPRFLQGADNYVQ